MIKFDSMKKTLLNNPDVEKEYDSLVPEFTIARTLIEARILAKMTQSDVAKKMKTSQAQIARLESGDHMPTLTSIHKYAHAINRNINIEISAN